jgi:hypothetical protein
MLERRIVLFCGELRKQNLVCANEAIIKQKYVIYFTKKRKKVRNA